MIADLALARAEGTPERFYSMSTQIEAEKKQHYPPLERSQKGGPDITAWWRWLEKDRRANLDAAHAALERLQL